jgi:hypothetical protein
MSSAILLAASGHNTELSIKALFTVLAFSCVVGNHNNVAAGVSGATLQMVGLSVHLPQQILNTPTRSGPSICFAHVGFLCLKTTVLRDRINGTVTFVRTKILPTIASKYDCDIYLYLTDISSFVV